MTRILSVLLTLVALFWVSSAMAMDPNLRIDPVNPTYQSLNEMYHSSNINEVEWKTLKLDMGVAPNGATSTFDTSCPYEIVSSSVSCAEKANSIRSSIIYTLTSAGLDMNEATNIANNLVEVQDISSVISPDTNIDVVDALTGAGGQGLCAVRKIPVFDVYLQGMVSLVDEGGDIKIHPVASYYVSWSVNGNRVTACVAVKTIDDKLLGCSCDPGVGCSMLAGRDPGDRMVAEFKVVRRCISVKDFM